MKYKFRFTNGSSRTLEDVKDVSITNESVCLKRTDGTVVWVNLANVLMFEEQKDE